jgi:hypothetical protein
LQRWFVRVERTYYRETQTTAAPSQHAFLKYVDQFDLS